MEGSNFSSLGPSKISANNKVAESLKKNIMFRKEEEKKNCKGKVTFFPIRFG